MAKVYSVVPIELRPGVNGEDFERFWIEEFAPLGAKLGWIGHVAKGDRGERTGKYAVIWEIPSVELRQRYSPAPGEASAELLDLLGPAFESADQKLKTLVEGWPYTDYVVIGK